MPLKDPVARAEYARQARSRNREKIAAYLAAWRLDNRDKVRADKKASWLAKHEENKARLRERYAADPEKYKAIGKEQYAKRAEVNREYAAEYRKVNRDAVVAGKQEYARLNRGKLNSAVAKRKAAKLQRTPAWLTLDDLWMIDQAYELAALRTKMFGFAWHVDHVIPLQGKTVSGLHTPYNMQVIPGIENVRKGNRRACG